MVCSGVGLGIPVEGITTIAAQIDGMAPATVQRQLRAP